MSETPWRDAVEPVVQRLNQVVDGGAVEIAFNPRGAQKLKELVVLLAEALDDVAREVQFQPEASP